MNLTILSTSIYIVSKLQ